MAKVTEGRLEFDFSAAAVVQRLDQPGTPLPHGMALVDFVVEEAKRILLIEVKDPEGTPAAHRAKALEDFIEKMKGNGLIHEEIVPKARDSYTFLHLMKQDGKSFILVCLLGVGTPDLALLGGFKDRLLARLRKEAATASVRQYVKDCVVVTPDTWKSVFPAYPLKVAYMDSGDWAWLPTTRQAVQIVTTVRLWGTEVVEVWLPAQGTTVRVTADQVESLERSATSVGPAELVYVAAAGHMADGLERHANLFRGLPPR